MSDFNMLNSELDDELRSAIEGLLLKVCDPARLIAMYDGNRTIADELWQQLRVELGFAGVLVPEEHGGAGLSFREASVAMEVLGQFAAATPFLTSAVVATTVLAETGSPLLAELASGEQTAAVALPLSFGPTDAVPAFSVNGAGQLAGSVRSVAGALEADVFIVPARNDGRIALYLVPAAALAVTPRPSLDMTRQVADLSAACAAGSLISDDGEDLLRRAWLAGAAMLASEQAGLARRCLDTTVDYLKGRKQFARPLGSFQALKHRLADLYVMVEGASAASRYAAIALAENETDWQTAVAVAQAHCSDVAVLAAEETVQLHAGMGMTWEHPAHLYLKRAKADQLAFGTPGQYRATLADLVDLTLTGTQPQIAAAAE